LEVALFDERRLDHTLEQRIRETIINDLVLTELNNQGQPYDIPIESSFIESVGSPIYTHFLGSTRGTVIRVPPQNRAYRNIVSVTRLAPASHLMSGGYSDLEAMAGFGASSMQSKALDVVDSYTGRGQGGYPIPILQRGNIVVVHTTFVTSSVMLECTLGVDSDFSGISSEVVDAIANYAQLVAKGYVFNKLIISTDGGQIISGAPIGQFRDQVLEYRSDASPDRLRQALHAIRGGLNVVSPRRLIRTIGLMV
jgi:hypothetical protein